MTIGERIKERRIELDLSIEDVAKKLGKNRATVYRYESDYILHLPITVLEPLAEVLQTTPAYLMGWGYASNEDIIKQLQQKSNVSIQDFIEEYNKIHCLDITLDELERIGNLSNGRLTNLIYFFTTYTTYLLELFNQKEKQLTMEEKAILKAYREHPELQRSVKLLLGLEKIDE